MSSMPDQPAPPLRIALTGGIASGKSAAADHLAALGVPVLDTDRIAREVVEPGTPTLARLVEAFGPDSLDGSGRLHRARLRERPFPHPARRRRPYASNQP